MTWRNVYTPPKNLVISPESLRFVRCRVCIFLGREMQMGPSNLLPGSLLLLLSLSLEMQAAKLLGPFTALKPCPLTLLSRNNNHQAECKHTHSQSQSANARVCFYFRPTQQGAREPVLSENANEAAVRSLSLVVPLLSLFSELLPRARERAPALSAPTDADANTKRVEAQQWTESAAVCVFIKSPRAPGFLEYARRGLLFLWRPLIHSQREH